jgi:small-conductance mechanosensitive channel
VVSVSYAVPPDRVIASLQSAANACPTIKNNTKAQVFASAFSDACIRYQITFAVDDYLQADAAQSDVISRVVESFRTLNISIGIPATDIRIIQEHQCPSTTPQQK